MGFYMVFLGFPGFIGIFTQFYLVIPSFTGFYWVLLGFTGFYCVLFGFTGCYRLGNSFFCYQLRKTTTHLTTPTSEFNNKFLSGHGDSSSSTTTRSRAGSRTGTGRPRTGARSRRRRPRTGARSRRRRSGTRGRRGGTGARTAGAGPQFRLRRPQQGRPAHPHHQLPRQRVAVRRVPLDDGRAQLAPHQRQRAGRLPVRRLPHPPAGRAHRGPLRRQVKKNRT